MNTELEDGKNSDPEEEITEEDIDIEHEHKKVIEVKEYLAPESIIAGLNEAFKVYVTLPVKEKGKKAVLTKMPFLLQVPPGYVTKGLVDQTATNFELQDAVFTRDDLKYSSGDSFINSNGIHMIKVCYNTTYSIDGYNFPINMCDNFITSPVNLFIHLLIYQTIILTHSIHLPTRNQ